MVGGRDEKFWQKYLPVPLYFQWPQKKDRPKDSKNFFRHRSYDVSILLHASSNPLTFTLQHVRIPLNKLLCFSIKNENAEKQKENGKKVNYSCGDVKKLASQSKLPSLKERPFQKR